MKLQCVLFLCSAVIQAALASEVSDSSALPTSGSSQSSFHIIRRQLDFSSCTGVCFDAASATPLNCAQAQVSENILFNCLAECGRTENDTAIFLNAAGIDDPCIYGDFTCTANEMCALSRNVSLDTDLGLVLNGTDCGFTCANYIVDDNALDGFALCESFCFSAFSVTPLSCAQAQISENALFNCLAQCGRTEIDASSYLLSKGINDTCIYGAFTCTANDLCALSRNVSLNEDLGLVLNGTDCGFTCANYILDINVQSYALCESQCTTRKALSISPMNCEEDQEIENSLANCLAECGRLNSDSVAFLTAAGFDAPCISGGFTCTANEVCALYRNVSLDEDLGIMLNGTECGFTCANYIVDSLYLREGFDLCQALCGIAAGATPMTCAEAQARDNNLFNCFAECGRTENDTVTYLNAVGVDDPCIYGDFTCTATDLCALARNVSPDEALGIAFNGVDCGFTCANYIVDDSPPTSSPVMPPSSTDAPTSSPVLPSSTDAPTPSTTVPSSATRRADFNMVKMAPLLVLVISLLGY